MKTLQGIRLLMNGNDFITDKIMFPQICKCFYSSV